MNNAFRVTGVAAGGADVVAVSVVAGALVAGGEDGVPQADIETAASNATRLVKPTFIECLIVT